MAKFRKTVHLNAEHIAAATEIFQQEVMRQFAGRRDMTDSERANRCTEMRIAISSFVSAGNALRNADLRGEKNGGGGFVGALLNAATWLEQATHQHGTSAERRLEARVKELEARVAELEAEKAAL